MENKPILLFSVPNLFYGQVLFNLYILFVYKALALVNIVLYHPNKLAFIGLSHE